MSRKFNESLVANSWEKQATSTQPSPNVFGTSTTGQKQFTTGRKQDRDACVLTLSTVVAKPQIRTTFDQAELDSLAHSLKTLGQQQPITVYWDDIKEQFIVVQGERRYRAALSLGWKEIKARVLDRKPNDDELIEIQWAENAVRQDLNEIEVARSLKKLIDLRHYTQRELAERVGKSQASVARSLSYLKLTEDIQDQIASGKIPPSFGYEMTKLATHDEQRDMAARYLSGELNVTTAQTETSSNKNAQKNPSKTKKSKDWTINGIAIRVTYPGATTNADIATALQAKADDLLKDGRTKAVRSDAA